MSKAKIVEHLGKGKYRVKLQIDIRAIKAQIESLKKRIEQANQRINNELKIAVDTTKATLNAIAIPQNLSEHSAELAQIMGNLLTARAAYDKAVKALDREKTLRENIIDEKGKLGAYKDEEERDIWCADYTTDLKPDTEVGVIDWYQLRGTSTPHKHVILPGYLAGKECKYDKVRDGRRVPQGGLNTYSWWYAMMLCPGMERFNPHYRKGTITAINDKGRVDVTVDEVYTQVLHSEAKALSAKELNLTNVPVRYLSCDSAVFEVGDRVVIEYPRKNSHRNLVDTFSSSRQALEAKSGELRRKIADYKTQTEAKQLIMNTLQNKVNERVKLLEDDKINKGIPALQAEIAALDEQIANLKTATEELRRTKTDADSKVRQLSGTLNTKNILLSTAQQELDQLIADSAPQSQVDAKRDQIFALATEISTLTQNLWDQQSIRDTTDNQITDRENQRQNLLLSREKKKPYLSRCKGKKVSHNKTCILP